MMMMVLCETKIELRSNGYPLVVKESRPTDRPTDRTSVPIIILDKMVNCNFGAHVAPKQNYGCKHGWGGDGEGRDEDDNSAGWWCGRRWCFRQSWWCMHDCDDADWQMIQRGLKSRISHDTLRCITIDDTMHHGSRLWRPWWCFRQWWCIMVIINIWIMRIKQNKI